MRGINTSEAGSVVPYRQGDAGIVVVNKPAGCTSFDIVAQIRRIYGTKKVGHAGTLDPSATGVLVIGVGRATKFLGYLTLADKTYSTTIRLGAATITDDADGEVIFRADPAYLTTITDAHIHHAAATFIGSIMQKPAQVSAIKVNGQRAYKAVRSGESIDLEAREVHISQCSILSIDRREDFIDCQAIVTCSSGTYIRAIARDLGELLGVGGHICALHRSRVGIFDHCHDLDSVRENPILDMTLERAAYHLYPHRKITAEQYHDLRCGRTIAPCGIQQIYAAVIDDDTAAVLLEERDGVARSKFFIEP